MEYLANFLHQTVGEIKIPLYYLLPKLDILTGVASLILRGKTYSYKNGSVEKELIMRSSQNHPNFREDNSKVYDHIEEAIRIMRYAALIKPYHKSKNVKGHFSQFFPNIQ